MVEPNSRGECHTEISRVSGHGGGYFNFGICTIRGMSPVEYQVSIPGDIPCGGVGVSGGNLCGPANAENLLTAKQKKGYPPRNIGQQNPGGIPPSISLNIVVRKTDPDKYSPVTTAMLNIRRRNIGSLPKRPR